MVSIWDDENEDGDVVSVFFNDKCILATYELKNAKKELIINVPPNQVNKLLMYAHNVGERPPNTAALSINDGGKERRIKLTSDLRASEAVNIIYDTSE